jgi:hypothetical protein
MSIQEQIESVRFMCQFAINDDRVASVLNILRAFPEVLDDSSCGPLLTSGNAILRTAVEQWQAELSSMGAVGLAAKAQSDPNWLMNVAPLPPTPQVVLIWILVVQTRQRPIPNMALCRRVVGNLYRGDRKEIATPEVKGALQIIQGEETDPIVLRAVAELLSS